MEMPRVTPPLTASRDYADGTYAQHKADQAWHEAWLEEKIRTMPTVNCRLDPSYRVDCAYDKLTAQREREACIKHLKGEL